MFSRCSRIVFLWFHQRGKMIKDGVDEDESSDIMKEEEEIRKWVRGTGMNEECVYL